MNIIAPTSYSYCDCIKSHEYCKKNSTKPGSQHILDHYHFHHHRPLQQHHQRSYHYLYTNTTSTTTITATSTTTITTTSAISWCRYTLREEFSALLLLEFSSMRAKMTAAQRTEKGRDKEVPCQLVMAYYVPTTYQAQVFYLYWLSSFSQRRRVMIFIILIQNI